MYMERLLLPNRFFEKDTMKVLGDFRSQKYSPHTKMIGNHLKWKLLSQLHMTIDLFT